MVEHTPERPPIVTDERAVEMREYAGEEDPLPVIYALLDTRAELVKALSLANAYMPQGYTNCQGYKCRQSNCEACFQEPAPLPRFDNLLAQLRGEDA